jgi:hypothetical protein
MLVAQREPGVEIAGFGGKVLQFYVLYVLHVLKCWVKKLRKEEDSGHMCRALSFLLVEFSTFSHPDNPNERVAKASLGLIPQPFLITIVYLNELGCKLKQYFSIKHHFK